MNSWNLADFSHSFNQLNNSSHLQNLFLKPFFLMESSIIFSGLRQQILKQIHSQVTVYKFDSYKLFSFCICLVWFFNSFMAKSSWRKQRKCAKYHRWSISGIIWPYGCLKEAGLPPAVEVALIGRQLYEAICGTAHLFCSIKSIFSFF